MDAARLARAVFLEAHRIAPGRFIVTGGREPHAVTITPGTPPSCDCADAQYNGVLGCKHSLAVRLHLADGDVLAGLRAVVPMPPKRAKRKVASRG